MVRMDLYIRNILITRKFRLFIIVAVLCSVYFILNLKIFSRITLLPGTKCILYWSPFWVWEDYHIGQGYIPFKNCKYKNCFATANRNLVPLAQVDALVFHATTFNRSVHGAPAIRFPHQKYILMNVEAPVHNDTPNLAEYNSYFNWTMSYRYDSDIIWRHGYFFKEETNYTFPKRIILNNKTRLAAWFVSNCYTASQREILTNEIQRYIDVDTYGKCGTFKCDHKEDDPPLSDPKCYDMLERQYKFYFSFENSYCKDYSTEKLYNVLQKNVVPVVYGAGNYSISAPPFSVINVEDFNSTAQLVHYLKYLDNNDREYLKYFEWKNHYRLTNSLEPCACQLCQKLNEDTSETIYHNLEEWWWDTNKEICKVAENLPKIVRDLIS